MKFLNFLTLLLGAWFIFLGISKGSTFYWSGYLGRAPAGRRGPTIPRWIGVPFFVGLGVWLLYISFRALLGK